jgi:hypothetical protein
MTEEEFVCRHFFVDEAGDLTFFRKKKIIVGEEGCSNFFMVGAAEIVNPEEVRQKLTQLREDLLADVYFRGVPSMQPEANKTAVFFHAKNDLPEVRREVFKVLLTCNVKVTVAIRRKQAMAEHFQKEFREKGKKFSDNQIYDDLISRIFKDRLHNADECRITFARLGKSERREALFSALEKAKKKFERKVKAKTVEFAPLEIQSAYPSEVIGLQVIDYYLWVLQRMFEKGEDRFFQMFCSHFKLIMDIDDRRRKNYGEWYSSDNPCDGQKIKLI